MVRHIVSSLVLCVVMVVGVVGLSAQGGAWDTAAPQHLTV